MDISHSYIAGITLPIFRLWAHDNIIEHRSLTMTYDECTSLVDFLSNRLRKFKSPWHAWPLT